VGQFAQYFEFVLLRSVSLGAVPESPAGWYPDPLGRHESRYWDGATWTEHVASRGRQTIDPPGNLEPVPTAGAPLTPGGWYPDPLGRHESRYWDGGKWTEHVASRGRQGADPPVGATSVPIANDAPALPPEVAPAPATTSREAKKIQKQVQKLGLADVSGTPDLAILDEPVLVINQKGKLVELRAEYAIHNQNGLQLAVVRGKRVSSRIQVVDMTGRLLLDLRREASLLSSKVSVAGAKGAKIGRIVPSLSWNKIDRDFKLEGADNELIGAVYAEDRRRRREFNVQDATSTVVAQISKTRAGLAKELLTKGDNYVVSIPGPLSDPLRSLTIAATLVIDSAFHQK
jgi:uncharacterized protein YxjI